MENELIPEGDHVACASVNTIIIRVTTESRKLEFSQSIILYHTLPLPIAFTIWDVNHLKSTTHG
jgi:hypothetical protein